VLVVNCVSAVWHTVTYLLMQIVKYARILNSKCSKRKKGKGSDLYSAFIVVPHTQGTPVRITQLFTCTLHRICLYLVSVHQMAPPQTEVADI